MAWCCVAGTPVWLWLCTGQQSAHTDMTKAHPLLHHRHPLNSQVDPKGLLNKVGIIKLKLLGSLTFTPNFLKVEQFPPALNLLCCLCFEEWEKDDQYNGSPPRPAPRGPRTPPGPPPPDDDDEEQVQVTGQNCAFALCYHIISATVRSWLINNDRDAALGRFMFLIIKHQSSIVHLNYIWKFYLEKIPRGCIR